VASHFIVVFSRQKERCHFVASEERERVTDSEMDMVGQEKRAYV